MIGGGSPNRRLDGELEYRIVDAFTAEPFQGNPAAVILPGPGAEGLSDAQLQALAAEMNLSETAFPGPPDARGIRPLRWFTPTTEVTLCGHATLAASHALLEEGESGPFRFHSLSGELRVEEQEGELQLDFPSDPPRRVSAPSGLMAALDLPPDTPFLTGARCAVVPVGSAAQVATLEPDMAALERVELPAGVMGVSVTAPAQEEDADFTSRFFGPWVGVDEDPVTGMAHTVLGPWWAKELGRSALKATQGGHRKGRLGVRIAGDRVHLLGHAITVARGHCIRP